MRSITIDAENEEEYIKEYERTRKSRLTKQTFEEKENEKVEEAADEKDNLSPEKNKRQSFTFQPDSDEDDYGGLGAKNNDADEYEGLGPISNDKDEDEDEEDNLGADNVEDNLLKDSEDDVNNNRENSEEHNVNLLCIYLKNSISLQSKAINSKNGENIFYRNKNNINTLSFNAIYDLNVRELVDNIIDQNNNEEDITGGPGSLKEFICQNIESDCNLKIMFMSNNKTTKKLLVEKFLDINNSISSIEKEEMDSENIEIPFEIRKKIIRLFNKNVNLQVFDTSDLFHKNPISSVYYKNSNAFFIFIEATNHNSKDYLDFILEKIGKYSSGKTLVIFGVNMLFKDDCTIDGNNLREYASDKDMMFVPIKKEEFNTKNRLIINLLNLVLIKRIDNKNSKENLRRGKKEKSLGGMKKKLANKIAGSSKFKNNFNNLNKMKISSSIGYKKKYRIRHIDAFDFEDFSKKIQRKWSVDL